jgi:hypothetical protein
MNSYYHFFLYSLYVSYSGNKYAFNYLLIYLKEIIPNPSAWITVFEGINS